MRLRDRLIVTLYETDNGKTPTSLTEARLIYGAKADLLIEAMADTPSDDVADWILTAVVIKSGIDSLTMSEVQQASHWGLEIESTESGISLFASPYKKT